MTCHARRFIYKAMLFFIVLSLMLPAPIRAMPSDQALPAGPATPQAIFTVLNTDDSGPGSLRQAVLDANPGDTIVFTSTLASQTITLTTGQIDIDQSIVIDGSAAPGISISGNAASRIFYISSPDDITVTLQAVNIVQGLGDWSGGGVANYANLKVITSRFAENVVVAGEGASRGGGLYNYGTAEIYDSVFVSNTADLGGALYNDGAFAIFNSTISDNEAAHEGGGAYNSFDFQPTAPEAVSLTIFNSTFSGNHVTDGEIGAGGGLLNRGPLTIVNSTFYSNTSAVSESGGGLYNDEGASLSLANTVIAYSTGGDCVNFGSISSNVNSLIEDESCAADFSGDPLLGPLADNGGPTLTHLPLTDSPLIDAGDDASAAGLVYDQRGPGYPRLVNGTVDIGAVEAPAPILNVINDSPTVLSSPTIFTATAPSGYITYTWNFGDGSAEVSGVTPITNYTYSAVGFYTAVITATDGETDLTGTTPVTITDQPILNLVAVNDSPTLLGQTTHLTATATGSNIAYTWAFGDGATGSDATPSHVYPAVGAYTATVTAANGILTLTATTRVTIAQPPIRHIYLPLIMSNYFAAPDLIVHNVIASSNAITVVIKNVGDAPATESFWVDTYVAPNPPPTAVNQIWWDQNRSQQGIAWAVIDPIVPLQPGQAITLTSTDPTVSLERTYFTGNLPVSTPIYAQVDSYNFYTDYGAVRERHEILGQPYNNILGPVLSQAGASSVRSQSAPPLGDSLRYVALPARPARP